MSELPLIVGYEPQRVLGSGATGTVFLARQLSTGREVAIKALASSLVADPGFRERFRSEARLMTRFDNENLVNIYDYLETDDGGVYLIMQFVPGISLRELIGSEHRFTPEQALGVLAGALSGLAAAHRLEVVHGDLKPENVIVTPEGVSKLVDFGQASPSGSRPSGGSPAYASPEAVRDETVDSRSDIYGAGLILYELLAGGPPFSGNAAEVAAAHRDTAPPRLRHVPEAVAGLVARALSKQPDDRPGTAEDFLAELEAAATASYGPNWLSRGSIAALAGGLAGGAVALGAGALGSGGAAGAGAAAGAAASTSGPSVPGVHAAGSTLKAAAHISRLRRLGTSVHKIVAAHPIAAPAASVAVVAASVLVAVLPGSATPPIAGDWVALSMSASPSAITCRDATHCWADLGSALLILGPSGRRSVVQVPVPGGTVKAISCGTDQDCVAVGTTPAGIGMALVSADGGERWKSENLPTRTGALTAVSCAPGTTSCWATSVRGVLVKKVLTQLPVVLHTPNGSTWDTESFPPGIGDPGIISCGTTRNCVAIAGSTPVWTGNGGLTWTAARGLAELYGTSSVDCASATVCWSVGAYQNSLQSQIGAAFRTTDGGATWTDMKLPASPQPYALDSISCSTTSSCLADGTIEEGGLESSSGSPYFLSTTDAGASWTVHLAAQTLPFVPEIACPRTGVCWLAGESGVGVTSDGGSTWAPQIYSPKLTLGATACVGPDRCYIAGAFPYATKSHLGAFVLTGTTPMGVIAGVENNGDQWQLTTSDLAVTGFAGLSCPPGAAGAASPPLCTAIALVANNQVRIVRLVLAAHSGASILPLPNGVDAVNGISCVTPQGCWLTGDVNNQPAILRELSDGRWTQVSVPAEVRQVTGITCLSNSQCLVLASGATAPLLLELASNGSGRVSWHAVSLPKAVESLSAIECATSTVCWIAAAVAPPVSPNGSSRGTSAPQTTIFRTVDLSTLPGVLATATSSSTTTSTAPPAANLANETPWAREPLPQGVSAVSSLSCPTTDFCLATGTLSSGAQVLLGAGTVGETLNGELAPPPAS